MRHGADLPLLGLRACPSLEGMRIEDRANLVYYYNKEAAATALRFVLTTTGMAIVYSRLTLALSLSGGIVEFVLPKKDSFDG